MPTIAAPWEVKKESSHIRASHLGVSNLLGVAMTFESLLESFTAFKDFTDLILAKLDMFEITSSQAEKSFVFGYQSMVQIRALPFVFFLLFFFMFDTWLFSSFIPFC